MPTFQTMLLCAGAALLGIILIRLFFSPLKFAFKAVFKTAGGFLWLALINSVGAAAGISLGFNLCNAAIIGLLGLPGTALLLFSRWALLL